MMDTHLDTEVELKKFEITCNCSSKNITTNFKEWDGYSEYTVLDSGCLSMKCKDCGAYASLGKNLEDWKHTVIISDDDKVIRGMSPKGHNKIELFKIRCKICNEKFDGFYSVIGKIPIEYNDGYPDGENNPSQKPFLKCRKCKTIEYSNRDGWVKRESDELDERLENEKGKKKGNEHNDKGI